MLNLALSTWTILSWLAKGSSALNSDLALHGCKTLELTLYQENGPSGSDCKFISLRPTQFHRGLEEANVMVERKPTHRSTHELNSQYDERTDVQIRLYACLPNKLGLFHAAQAECPEGLVDIPGGYWDAAAADDQSTLSAPSDTGRVTTSPSMVAANPPPLEVRPLFISGPSENRVDLVFFADGYVEAEKEKFYDDAYRLAQDMSQNHTFASVKALLNFWAAFTPSEESGIGVGGKPKNTTFGLYRDGTELRGVYSSRLKVARAAALSLGTQCDYPILLGNDPLYGGLGGEFTISTVSKASGPLVLRHELGHSIIQVGEEYDGGFAYFGPNSQHVIKNDTVKWAHWLTPTGKTASPPPSSIMGPILPHRSPYRVERSVMPLQNYAWTPLNDSTSPFTVPFNSSGAYSRYVVQFSISGITSQTHLRVELDGEDLAFVPRKDIGVDRWFYEIPGRGPLSEGKHTLSFSREKSSVIEGGAVVQLCSVEVIEYGDDKEFNTVPSAISLFPTFSMRNRTTYRPTNDGCLMRRVVSPDFCPVCLEGLWLQLLKRVDLIDSVSLAALDEAVEGEGRIKPLELSAGSWNIVRSDTPVLITLSLLPIGLSQAQIDEKMHVRQNTGVRHAPSLDASSDHLPGEAWTISWTKDGESLEKFTNSTRIIADSTGEYEAKVRFHTDQVRRDDHNLLISGMKVKLYFGS